MKDRNYKTLAENEGSSSKFPINKQIETVNLDRDLTDQMKESLIIDDYLAEFDIKDILEPGNSEFNYTPTLENRLSYNVLNGFKPNVSLKT